MRPVSVVAEGSDGGEVEELRRLLYGPWRQMLRAVMVLLSLHQLSPVQIAHLLERIIHLLEAPGPWMIPRIRQRLGRPAMSVRTPCPTHCRHLRQRQCPYRRRGGHLRSHPTSAHAVPRCSLQPAGQPGGTNLRRAREPHRQHRGHLHHACCPALLGARTVTHGELRHTVELFGMTRVPR